MEKRETLIADIIVNGTQAKSTMNKMQKDHDALVESQKRLYSSLKKEDREAARQMQSSIDASKKRLMEYQRLVKGLGTTINNVANSSYKELNMAVKALNKELRSGHVQKGSREWQLITAKIRECKAEMLKMNAATEIQATKWQRFSKFLNDSWGGLTLLISSITGMSFAIRGTVKSYSEMEEAMADTRKYTGLSDVAIRELNEDLKKIDTRTGREELNELAGAAGRLGKTSKQDILDFVEAGNMIKVALGDDLGEGAIDKVGKLAMAFGEDERMGLRGAMLATGSAINELAQNSSAQAGYLVDFTARVAGFGKQLGLTQAQIMGFGAVMDENLLRDEMAATAFGNMLTKMQTDTAKFAQIAGMDVEKFSKLLKEDANGAILALADSLKRAEPQTMMKMLDDMGLDGSRAVGVLSTLADKIDDVRARQELATKAYAEGTSVQKEYSTMNNTVQAEIDKAKKKFSELSIELGEKLLPVVKYTINASSLFIKALSVILNFTYQNIGAITKITAILAEYLAVKKLHALWSKRMIAIDAAALALDKAQAAVARSLIAIKKAQTLAILAHNGAITKTVALQRLWNEVLMKNPIAIVTTLVVGLTYGIYKLASSIGAANTEQKLNNELTSAAVKGAAEERAEIALLVEKARDQNLELDKRKEAIEKLNSIIPGYNGQLDETTGKYNENSNALANYNALLLEKYRLEAAEDKLKEIEKEKFQNDLEYDERMRLSRDREKKGGTFLNRWAQTQGPQAQGSNTEVAFQQQITKEHQKQTEEYNKKLEIVKGIRQQSQEAVSFGNSFNNMMEKQRKSLEGDNGKVHEDNEATNGGSYAGDSGSGAKKSKTDPYESSLKEIKEKYKASLLELRLNHEAMKLSDDEYHKESFEGEMNYHQQVLELQEKYGKSTVDTQNAILDSIAKEANRKYVQQHEEMQAELAAADDAYQSDKMAMMQLYLRGELGTEEDYNNKKKEAEMDYLKQRLSIIKKYGGDTQKADAAILEKEFEDFVNDKKKRLDDLNKSFNEADTFSKQVEINEAMYAQDLISFEEYQQRKQQIAQESSDRQREINDMLYQQIGATMQSISSLFSAMQNSEIAEVESRYDKQIQAAQKAGRNTTQLEKKKEKEIAKIKSKYADREFEMKILEITADTAVGIAKLWKNPGYPWAIPLTALVAAQGAMQMAVAKKAQQQAKKGYYEGGFTGGRRYHREAGVVHEGEFVANHQTVQNPNVMPLLELIDRAQRNNTVGSLSQEDIARQLGTGNNTIAPIVNVTTDNEVMRQSVESLKNAADSLSDRLSEPQPCYVVMDGPNGLYIQLKHYENLKKL